MSSLTDPSQANRPNLTDSTVRQSFITDILVREAQRSSSEFGKADYTDVVDRLAEVFSSVIGDRRGPFRDQTEQMATFQRLMDIGFGFLAGVNRERINNYMIQSWVSAVIAGFNQNFTSS